MQKAVIAALQLYSDKTLLNQKGASLTLRL